MCQDLKFVWGLGKIRPNPMENLQIQGLITPHIFDEKSYSSEHIFLYSVCSYTESSMVIDQELKVREGSHFCQFWCVLLQDGDLYHGTVDLFRCEYVSVRLHRSRIA
jgi:hypothetical protein